jgi:hypothetical protein
MGSTEKAVKLAGSRTRSTLRSLPNRRVPDMIGKARITAQAFHSRRQIISPRPVREQALWISLTQCGYSFKSPERAWRRADAFPLVSRLVKTAADRLRQSRGCGRFLVTERLGLIA